MPLVAGVDSSTQSTKVLVVDSDTGEVVRQGSAPHPEGTEVDPASWQEAFTAACGNDLLARRGGDLRRWAAARHGRSRRRRRGGAAGDPLERHPVCA